jgi:hypothetical protein
MVGIRGDEISGEHYLMRSFKIQKDQFVLSG